MSVSVVALTLSVTRLPSPVPTATSEHWKTAVSPYMNQIQGFNTVGSSIPGWSSTEIPQHLLF